MKGELHERLRGLLQRATKGGLCTQESLARAMGKTQTSVGAYLRNVKGGALDLDEASAALEHIGSSLQEFLGSGVPVKKTPDVIPLRVLQALRTELDTRQLVIDLLDVPRPRRGVVQDMLSSTVRALRIKRHGGRES